MGSQTSCLQVPSPASCYAHPIKVESVGPDIPQSVEGVDSQHQDQEGDYLGRCQGGQEEGTHDLDGEDVITRLPVCPV